MPDALTIFPMPPANAIMQMKGFAPVRNVQTKPAEKAMTLEMNKLFSLEMPFVQFARNVALVTIASLIPVLLIYVVLRPGFGSMLLEGGPALSRFLRQVITNGLPVAFLVNYVSFLLFAWLNSRPTGKWDAAFLVPVDVAARLTAFFLLHVVIYVLSADWFGSFGGSRIAAQKAVAPTLARSALFDNISGVYLYSTVVSSVPLYLTAIERSALLSGFARGLPSRLGSLPIALALFGSFVLLLTGGATLIANLLQLTN